MTPVRYGDHEPVTRGTACVICCDTPTRPMMDHCHEHGWVRGPVCHSCNLLMSQIDRGRAPLAETLAAKTIGVSALLAQRARCQECGGIPWTGPNTGRARTAYTSIQLVPAAAADLRLFAARAEGNLGRRVTMTDALRVAVRIATAHLSTDAMSAATALGLIEPTTDEGKES